MKRNKLFLTGMLLLIAVCLLQPDPCLAGDVNGNEQSVYESASGTFDYNGGSYQASPEYLAQLQAYLSRDDVDLTPDQAQAAIAEMYANVERGVTEGYILPVGGNTADPGNGTENGSGSGTGTGPGTGNPSPGQSQGDGDKKDTDTEKEDKSDVKTDNGNKSSGNASDESGQQSATDIKKSADGKSVVTSNGSTYGGLSEKQQDTLNDRLSERVSEEDAESDIVYDKAVNAISFTTKNGEKYTLPADLNAENFAKQISMGQAVGIIFFVLTIICGILLAAFGCLKFQKNKENSEISRHNRKKRIRSITGIILSLVLAGNILLGALILYVQIGFFDSSKVTDSLEESGYYHEAYDNMMKDVYVLMDISGCLENTCDNILTYENFMFATRNQIQLSLRGEESSATYDDIQEDVAEAVSYVTYFTEDSRNQLGAAVLTLYQTAVRNVIGDTIYALKILFWEAMQFLMRLAAISGLLSVFLLLFGERYQHRGTKRIANSFLISGFAGAVFLSVLYFGKPYTSVFIKPDYLYLFIVEFITQSFPVLAALVGVGALIGIMLHLAAWGMKKRIK